MSSTLPLLGSALNQPQVRKCPYCGTMFTPNSHNQKFCSYHCRWDNRAKLEKFKRDLFAGDVARLSPSVGFKGRILGGMEASTAASR